MDSGVTTTTPAVQTYSPPLMVNQQQQTYTSRSHASVGPVIGVLAVITVLGIIAGFIGRFCSGRRLFGFGGPHFDVESWVETKCSSCLDGHVAPPPPPPPSHPHIIPDWVANGSLRRPIRVVEHRHQEEVGDKNSSDEEDQQHEPQRRHSHEQPQVHEKEQPHQRRHSHEKAQVQAEHEHNKVRRHSHEQVQEEGELQDERRRSQEQHHPPDRVPHQS